MGGKWKIGKRHCSPPSYVLNNPDIPGQVYFHQEIPYWTGRFSTLCDRLKTVDRLLVSSSDRSTLSSSSHLERANTEGPFQLAESRQTECALKELRSYCRTNVALRSFEEFEAQIRCHPKRRGEAQVQAKRVCEQRVLAKAERYRRASGQESRVGKAWTNKIAARPGGGVDR
jgi:hypothetical protein